MTATDELPDMTFTRALAKTVCRSLKIDPAPVLALLPEVGDRGPGSCAPGLEREFPRSAGQWREPADLAALKRPMLWLPLLVLLLAAAGLVPAAPGGSRRWAVLILRRPRRRRRCAALCQQTSRQCRRGDAAAVAASAAAAGGAGAGRCDDVADAAPASAPTDLGGDARTAGERRVVVEIDDASGATLLQRNAAPRRGGRARRHAAVRVKIGNVAVTQLKYRGQPVDLAAARATNVARLDLK